MTSLKPCSIRETGNLLQVEHRTVRADGVLYTDGISPAVALGHARTRNPIGCYRGALGNGAGATSFLATADRANARGQRALTWRQIE